VPISIVPPPDPEAAIGGNGAHPPKRPLEAAPDDIGPDDIGDASEFAAPDDETAGRGIGDGFDSLDGLALPQDFDPGMYEEDPPVEVRKPSAWDFIRVHPTMTLQVGIIEIPDERDGPYLVTPPVYALFGKVVSRRKLYVCKTSLMPPAAVFLWPARMPLEDQKKGGGRYNETAMQAAERAKTKWTKIQSDSALKCYRIFGPQEPLDEPVWPTATLLELIRRGFGDGHLVNSPNHPLVRRYKTGKA
jgi:hypothetical protein